MNQEAVKKLENLNNDMSVIVKDIIESDKRIIKIFEDLIEKLTKLSYLEPS